MRKRSWLLWLALTLVLAACNLSLAADITPPPGWKPTPVPPTPDMAKLYPLTVPDPAEGQAIYAEKCAACHGERGLGDGPQGQQLPNIPAAIGSAELIQNAIPAEWFLVLTRGRMDRFMPPFTSLSERQRWDVLAYLYTLAYDEQLVAQGEAVYNASCATCHGPDGRGSERDAIPDLTALETWAQQSDAQRATLVREGMGDMPPLGNQLSEDEVRAVVAYVRTLPWRNAAQKAATSVTPEATAQPTAVSTPEVTSTPGTQEGAPTPEGTTAPTAVAEITPGTEAPPSATATTPEVQTGTVTVSGVVTNGSGGEVPAGLKVVLHGYDNMAEALTLEGETDAEGRFTFTHVEAPTQRAFLVTVEYGGVTYGSDIAVALGDQDTLELPVTVYESTTDTSALRVERLHLFLDFAAAPGMLRVAELYIISNTRDATVVAAEPGQPVLTFDLPEGATNLQFQEGNLGDRYITVGNGFGDTTPIRPGAGSYQVLFAYDLPYSKARAEVRHGLNLPVTAVVVLAPAEGVKVKSATLQDTGTREIQGTVFRMFQGGPFSPGDTLAFTVSGKPKSQTGMNISSSGVGLVVGLVVFGLALVVAGFWLLRQRRGVGEHKEGDLDVLAADVADDPEALMDAILALDDLYREGRLPEGAYRQRRAELKERLKALLDADEEDDAA